MAQPVPDSPLFSDADKCLTLNVFTGCFYLSVETAILSFQNQRVSFYSKLATFWSWYCLRFHFPVELLDSRISAVAVADLLGYCEGGGLWYINSTISSMLYHERRLTLTRRLGFIFICFQTSLSQI